MPRSARPRSRRRAWPLALAFGLLALLATPLDAAPADWAGSKINSPALTDDDPSDQIPPKATVTTEKFPIRGLFQRNAGQAGTWRINSVQARYNRVGADTPIGEETPRDPADTCLPPDPTAVSRTPGSPTEPQGGKTIYDFTIPDTQSTWPCNGRYRVTVTASATSATSGETHTLRADLTVAVRPKPVTSVVAELDDRKDEITVDFEKLAAADTARDALPYRVQRAGPADADGDYGLFATVGDPIPLDGEPTLVDTVDEPGDYRYRVLSVRNGANGPIFALADITATTDVTVEPDPGEPTTTTTTAPDSPTTTAPGPRVGSARPLPTLPNRPAPLPAPPTTVDPGFDGELDYDGAAPLPRRQDDSPELAGEEGLSVIQTEDDGPGAGLVAPVAGGLVLLAWAGHGVYLNRLAKQF